MVREPIEAMFAAIDKAREYVLVESFIFEEAAAGDRTLSALLAQAAAAACSIYVLYDAVGSLTTDEAFLDGLEDGRHLALRVQSVESAR